MNADTLNYERVARLVRAMPALTGLASGETAAKTEADSGETSWQDLLGDYYRVMEIAQYVRRGGVKAMIYRVETGRAQFAPSDYFDEAHERLCSAFRDIYVPQATKQSMLERLAAVTTEEEESVRSFLSEIDSILLSERRKDAALAEDG